MTPAFEPPELPDWRSSPQMSAEDEELILDLQLIGIWPEVRMCKQRGWEMGHA